MRRFDGRCRIRRERPRSTAARAIASSQVDGVSARWLLSKRIDAFGNEIDYRYDSLDAGVRYPASVSYASGQRAIEFHYEARPFDAILGYPAGIERALRRRLREVRVLSAGHVERRIILAYEGAPTTGRSLLSAVQRFGSDCEPSQHPDLQVTSVEAAPCAALPAFHMDYTEAPATTAARWSEHHPADTLPLVPAINFGETFYPQTWGGDVQVADVDGDGFPDLLNDEAFASTPGLPNASGDPYPNDPFIVLNDRQGSWIPPVWAAGEPANAAAEWTEALRSLRFDLPVFRGRMTGAVGGGVSPPSSTGNHVHMGLCEVAGIEWEVDRGRVQLGGIDLEQQRPGHDASTDARVAPSQIHDVSATPWSQFHVVDLDADGRADLVMSIQLTGAHASLESCTSGVRGEPAWYGGARVSVVFRNTGDGWARDSARDAADGNLAEGLPAFGTVAIESPEYAYRSMIDASAYGDGTALRPSAERSRPRSSTGPVSTGAWAVPAASSVTPCMASERMPPSTSASTT